MGQWSKRCAAALAAVLVAATVPVLALATPAVADPAPSAPSTPTLSPTVGVATALARPGAVAASIAVAGSLQCGLRADRTIACFGTDQAPGASGAPSRLAVPPGAFQQVTVGRAHGCALDAVGTVTCWGDNALGQATPPAGAFASVVAADEGDFTCGVRPNGTVQCWGDNSHQVQTPPASTSFVSITAGPEAVCGITVSASIKCWGDNTYNEVSGAPTTGSFTQIDGTTTMCALSVSGTALCWGRNDTNQAKVPATARLRSVHAGGTTSCAVREKGTLLCWGKVTIAPPATGRYVAMDSSVDAFCAVREDGQLVCFGDSSALQIFPNDGRSYLQSAVAAGGNTTCVVRSTGSLACFGALAAVVPTSFPSGSPSFQQVTVGGAFICALRTDATVGCWGTIAKAPSGSFTSLSAGNNHACAVSVTGVPACWGGNSKGQARPPVGLVVRSVSAGANFSCAVNANLTVASTVTCWGDASQGRTNTAQLGATPVAITTGTTFACGLSATDAPGRPAGSVSCNGTIASGGTQPPGTYVGLEASSSSGVLCLVTTGASVECRGLTVPSTYGPSGTPVLAVAVGYAHACVLLVGGTIDCFGAGAAGQLPVPLAIANTTPPTAVAGQPYLFDPQANQRFGQFSLSAGTLPPGLTLDPVTGVISGTPGAAPASGSSRYDLTLQGTNGVVGVPLSVPLRIQLVSGAADFDSASATPPSVAGPGGAVDGNVDINLEAVGAPAFLISAGVTQAAPLRSSPLRSSPLRSSPLRSSPLRSSPLRSSPLRSSFMGPVLLSAAPLRSSSWSTVLAGTPFANVPETAVTLQQVFAYDSGPNGPIPGLNSITLDDVDLNATPLRSSSVTAVLLWNVPLSSLPDPGPTTTWCQAYGSLFGGSCSAVLAASLLDLEQKGADLTGYLANPLSLKGLDLSRSPLGLAALGTVDLTLTPFGGVATAEVAAAAPRLLACPAAGCAATLGQAQVLGQVASSATLGDLVALVGAGLSAPPDITVAEVLLGLLAPEERPINSASLDDIISSSPSDPANVASYSLNLVLSCQAPSAVPAVFVAGGVDPATAPATNATYRPVPGSFTLAIGSGAPGVIGDPVASPRTIGSLALQQIPTSAFGALCQTASLVSVPVTITGTFFVLGQAGAPNDKGPTWVVDSVTGSASTLSVAGPAVVDGRAKSGTPAATPIVLDHLYTGFVTDPSKPDLWRLPVPPKGATLQVFVSNVPADFDLTIYGPPGTSGTGDPEAGAAPLRSSPLRSSPLRSSPLRSSATGDASSDPTSATPGQPTATNDQLRIAGLPVRSTSINRATLPESAGLIVRDEDVASGGSFLIQVAGFNGANSTKPYALRAHVVMAPAALPCVVRNYRLDDGSPATVTLPAAASIDPAAQTLVLVNEHRTRSIYGVAATSPVMAAAVAYAARAEVKGVVIPVDQDASVQAAYDAWDTDSCSVAGANGVVRAINGLVDSLRGSLTDLRHLVIVGNDEVIPQGRVADLVDVENQQSYTDSVRFQGKDNPISSAFRQGFLLSDDPYGAFTPEAFLGGQLYVPDVALGRLVETPQEILDTFNRYSGHAGALAPSTAYVAGYDFLSDGAQAVSAALVAPSTIPGSGLPGQARSGSSAINETWTAADATAGLLPGGNGRDRYGSVNAHYNHYQALPAATFNGAVPDLFGVADLGTSVAGDPNPTLLGSILFTMGCEAGLNVPDVLVAAPSASDATKVRDWAQGISRLGGTFAGNTGYGYGDTAGVAYSERLMSYYATNLGSGSMSAGQAMLYAKQQMAGEPQPFNVYDAKALMEATFYGLPTYTVGTSGVIAPGALPTVQNVVPPTDPGLVLRSTPVPLTPASTPVTDPRGTRWTGPGGQQVIQPFQPAQPAETLDVTPGDGLQVHGYLVDHLESTDIVPVDPVITRPTVDLAANEPEPAFAGVFPSTIQTVSTVRSAQGLRTKLQLVTGQFFAQPEVNGGTPTQLLWTSIGGRAYRSNSNDWTAPTITQVTALNAAGAITFDAVSPDSDVMAGSVLWRTNLGESVWHTTSLSPAGGGRLTGSATLPVGAAQVTQFRVEVVDTSGNVSSTTNKGLGYQSAAAPAVPPTAVAPAYGGGAAVTPAQPVVGQVASALSGVWSGVPAPSLSFQWTCGGGTCTGTSDQSSYTPTGAELGKALAVSITATNGVGTPVTIATGPSVAVAGLAPTNAVRPSHAASVRLGETLTADPGVWDGFPVPGPANFTFAWSCDNGAGGTNCAGPATGSTYLPTGSDLGRRVSVAVTATTSAGATTVSSLATTPVRPPAPVAPVLVTAPALAANAPVGTALTVTDGTWTSNPPATFTYQWQRCTSGTCADLVGQTTNSYTPVAGDLGSTLKVIVTATNAAGTLSAPSNASTVVGVAPTVISPPTISGSPRVGSALVAAAGSWAGVPAPTFTYQWQCGPIAPYTCAGSGAATPTFTPGIGDYGKAVRVQVTATNGWSPAGVALSADTGPVLLPAGSVDVASVGVSGGVTYANTDQPLTSGSFRVTMNTDGTVRSVLGFGTMPSTVPGSSATLSVNVARIGSTYWGVVTLVDTAAGVSLFSPVLSSQVTAIDPNGATGSVTWAPAGKPSTTITWTIIDNNGAAPGAPAARFGERVVTYAQHASGQVAATVPGAAPASGVAIAAWGGGGRAKVMA